MKGFQALIQLLLVVIQIGVTTACPEICSCEDRVVDCSNRNLTEIPDLTGMSPGNAKLDLSGNKIKTFDVSQFHPILGSKLEELDLSNNQISSFQGIFNGATTKVFTTINLSQNLFATFPKNAIPEKTFDAIHILDLSHNKLKSLPPNIIEMNKDFVFPGLYLNVSNNEISEIRDDTFDFDKLSSFPRLDIRNNRLTSLNMTSKVHFFDHLYLSGNPWDCDCNLRWILPPTTSAYNATFRVGDIPKCATPPLNAGMYMFGLTSRDYACLPFQVGENPIIELQNQREFTLTCPVDADPPNPLITWSIWLPREGQSVPVKYVMASKNVTLSNVMANPGGGYLCKASNKAGSINIVRQISFNGEIIEFQQTPGIIEPQNSSGAKIALGILFALSFLMTCVLGTILFCKRNPHKAKSSKDKIIGSMRPISGFFGQRSHEERQQDNGGFTSIEKTHRNQSGNPTWTRPSAPPPPVPTPKVYATPHRLPPSLPLRPAPPPKW